MTFINLSVKRFFLTYVQMLGIDARTLVTESQSQHQGSYHGGDELTNDGHDC